MHTNPTGIGRLRTNIQKSSKVTKLCLNTSKHLVLLGPWAMTALHCRGDQVKEKQKFNFSSLFSFRFFYAIWPRYNLCHILQVRMVQYTFSYSFLRLKIRIYVVVLFFPSMRLVCVFCFVMLNIKYVDYTSKEHLKLSN